MPQASRAARQWSRQARAGIKELRERSGKFQTITIIGSSSGLGYISNFK